MKLPASMWQKIGFWVLGMLHRKVTEKSVKAPPIPPEETFVFCRRCGAPELIFIETKVAAISPDESVLWDEFLCDKCGSIEQFDLRKAEGKFE